MKLFLDKYICLAFDKRCTSRWKFVVLAFLVLLSFVQSSESVSSKEINSNSNNNSPCIPEDVLLPIQNAFKRLIPVFNPNGYFIQFKTDSRISMSPTSPTLVPYLVRYPSIAINQIGRARTQDPMFRKGMSIYFHTEYGKFLKQIGIPVSCISLYVGATDKSSTDELQKLSNTLQKKYPGGSKGPSRANSMLTSITGKDLGDKLSISGSTAPYRDVIAEVRSNETCDKIFWTLKDGSIVSYLPTMDSPPRHLRIPTVAAVMKTKTGNLTHEIARYFSTGIKCLNTNGEKSNFSATISKWLSVKLIPQLLQSSRCVQGFPNIFQLMISIEKYQAELLNRIHNTTNDAVNKSLEVHHNTKDGIFREKGNKPLTRRRRETSFSPSESNRKKRDHENYRLKQESPENNRKKRDPEHGFLEVEPTEENRKKRESVLHLLNLEFPEKNRKKRDPEHGFLELEPTEKNRIKHDPDLHLLNLEFREKYRNKRDPEHGYLELEPTEKNRKKRDPKNALLKAEATEKNRNKRDPEHDRLKQEFETVDDSFTLQDPADQSANRQHRDEKTITNNFPKKEADRLLYDAELRHLYNKLNTHFLKNNLKIARFDVVKLPTIGDTPELISPQAIVFHPLTTTTTTTTTSTTTTTTTPEPTTEEQTTTEDNDDDEENDDLSGDGNGDDEGDSHSGFDSETIGRRVKIVGEVEVNEDTLKEPISIFVEGEKLRAQLDVEPIRKMTDQNGKVLHFTHLQANINPKRSLHWHFGVRNHTRDPNKIRPLHMRQYLLKKKFGKSLKPDNFIAEFLNNGVHKIKDAAHFVLPKIFHGYKPDDPNALPKTHQFHSMDASQMKYLQHRIMHPEVDKKIEEAFKKNVEQISKLKHFKKRKPAKGYQKMSEISEGLVEIHETDLEFPKVKESDYYHGELHG